MGYLEGLRGEAVANGTHLCLTCLHTMRILVIHVCIKTRRVHLMHVQHSGSLASVFGVKRHAMHVHEMSDLIDADV